MFKRKLPMIIATSVIGCSLATFGIAASAPKAKPVSAFGGWYLGAGIQNINLDDQVNVNDNTGDSTKIEGAESGFGGIIYGGYGHTFNNKFYLGAEAFLGHTEENNHAFTIHLAPSTFHLDSISTRYSYGALLRGGYVFTPRVMLYALLGTEVTAFRITSDGLNVGTKNKFNKTQASFMPGIGLTAALKTHLLLRLQYASVFYPRFNKTISGNRYKIKPKRNIITLGLTYQFDDLLNGNKDYCGNYGKSAFNGAFLGLGLDHINLDDEYKLREQPNLFQLEAHGGQAHWGGRIFGGYGKTFNRFYLGAEAFAGYSGGTTTAMKSTSADLSFDSLKTQNYYGADLRLGIVTAPRLMLYGILGAQTMRFKVKSSNLESLVFNHFSKTETGFMPGIGAEIALTHHLMLRTQYTHVYYKTIENTSGEGVLLTTKVKPTRNTFTIGASYQFD